MEALKACPTVGNLRKTLDSLPSKLEDMYELTLQRINAQPEAIVAMARLALMWVSRARRRLTVQELLEAVATSYEPGSFVAGEFKEEDMPTWEILSSATGGLLISQLTGADSDSCDSWSDASDAMNESHEEDRMEVRLIRELSFPLPMRASLLNTLQTTPRKISSVVSNLHRSHNTKRSWRWSV